MDEFSALLALVRGINRPPMNSPDKGQWRGALKFSLIYPLTYGWVNIGDAGCLRRHCSHYDDTVMDCSEIWQASEQQNCRRANLVASIVERRIPSQSASNSLRRFVSWRHLARWCDTCNKLLPISVSVWTTACDTVVGGNFECETDAVVGPWLVRTGMGQ